MNIILNQQPTDAAELVGDDHHIAALVAALKQDRPGVAVAKNDAIVSRSDWSTTSFAAGDRIDIFSVIAGG
ncbi:sulfur carrier protein ThiS [Ferrimonas senticii]|uniref:sulfur carrier protein ThiS n=1 Tax=Ferrimonas senticii TaxID=394566 RepID=UPI0004285B19|nr:sulfur carrier protein ThiS [Ferrimonas senticii]